MIADEKKIAQTNTFDLPPVDVKRAERHDIPYEDINFLPPDTTEETITNETT